MLPDIKDIRIGDKFVFDADSTEYAIITKVDVNNDTVDYTWHENGITPNHNRNSSYPSHWSSMRYVVEIEGFEI